MSLINEIPEQKTEKKKKLNKAQQRLKVQNFWDYTLWKAATDKKIISEPVAGRPDSASDPGKREHKC